jgi:hypothetical protein
MPEKFSMIKTGSIIIFEILFGLLIVKIAKVSFEKS